MKELEATRSLLPIQIHLLAFSHMQLFCFVLIPGVKWSNWCICPLVHLCSGGNIQQQSAVVKKCHPWANCAVIGQKSYWKDSPQGDNVLSSLFPQKKAWSIHSVWIYLFHYISVLNIPVFIKWTTYPGLPRIHTENKVLLHLIRCKKESPMKMGSASVGLADCILTAKEQLQGFDRKQAKTTLSWWSWTTCFVPHPSKCNCCVNMCSNEPSTSSFKTTAPNKPVWTP